MILINNINGLCTYIYINNGLYDMIIIININIENIIYYIIIIIINIYSKNIISKNIISKNKI